MTSQERQRDRHALLALREQLELDLAELADAIAAERAKAADRQEANRALKQRIDELEAYDQDVARLEWYAAEYQDAQQTMVVTNALVARYSAIAQQLSECQQQLMQSSRIHRRGKPHSGN